MKEENLINLEFYIAFKKKNTIFSDMQKLKKFNSSRDLHYHKCHLLFQAEGEWHHVEIWKYIKEWRAMEKVSK